MQKISDEDFKNTWEKIKQINTKYPVVFCDKPYFIYCKSLRSFYLETITVNKSGVLYIATHKISQDKTFYYNFLLKVISEEKRDNWIEQHKKGLPIEY